MRLPPLTAADVAQAAEAAWDSVIGLQLARFPDRAALFLPTKLTLETQVVRPRHIELGWGWEPAHCLLASPPCWWRRIGHALGRRPAHATLLIDIERGRFRMTIDGIPPAKQETD